MNYLSGIGKKVTEGLKDIGKETKDFYKGGYNEIKNLFKTAKNQLSGSGLNVTNFSNRNLKKQALINGAIEQYFSNFLLRAGDGALIGAGIGTGLGALSGLTAGNMVNSTMMGDVVDSGSMVPVGALNGLVNGAFWGGVVGGIDGAIKDSKGIKPKQSLIQKAIEKVKNRNA